jgi:hypothetical protein
VCAKWTRTSTLDTNGIYFLYVPTARAAIGQAPCFNPRKGIFLGRCWWAHSKLIGQYVWQMQRKLLHAASPRYVADNVGKYEHGRPWDCACAGDWHSESLKQHRKFLASPHFTPCHVLTSFLQQGMDNFAVGAAYGCRGRRVRHISNGIIALSNALTTLGTMLVGSQLLYHLSERTASNLGHVTPSLLALH